MNKVELLSSLGLADVALTGLILDDHWSNSGRGTARSSCVYRLSSELVFTSLQINRTVTVSVHWFHCSRKILVDTSGSVSQTNQLKLVFTENIYLI